MFVVICYCFVELNEYGGRICEFLVSKMGNLGFYSVFLGN